MAENLAIIAGKIVSFVSKTLKIGAGVTWAGEIALQLDPKIISKLIPKTSKVILVAGTNGKTTTVKLLKSILPNAVSNDSGANLLNGIAGTLILSKPANYYIFEVDENNLILLLKHVPANIVILLNLFRDQLDRYGEVDKIAKDWEKLQAKNFVINADDPQLAFIGKRFKDKVFYFGLNDKKLFLEKMQHATDSIFCPNCGERLNFSGVYFSHLGEYKCEKCGFSHPKNNRTYKYNKSNRLEGVYNFYNILAAESVAEILKIKGNFANFQPAFGRGEEIGGTKILLSKNPAGFNESLRTVINSKKKGPLLLALNDRIPDGRDVSWIWDVDFEMLQKYKHPIYVSGDRQLDLALRLKYAEVKYILEENLGVSWILATYSAMLDIRKELTGKKIL